MNKLELATIVKRLRLEALRAGHGTGEFPKLVMGDKMVQRRYAIINCGDQWERATLSISQLVLQDDEFHQLMLDSDATAGLDSKPLAFGPCYFVRVTW